MSRPIRLVTVLAVLFLIAGCSSDEGDPAAELYGEWLTSEGTTVTYNEDGTWSAQWPGYGPEPFDWGTYTFDGGIMTYFTDPGGRSCQEGQTGIYEATIIDEQNLSLKSVEESCSGRGSDFFGGMIRKSS